MIRELQSLALDVELMERPKKKMRRRSELLEEAEAALTGASVDIEATENPE